ncbi:hypothetical protein ACWDTP_28630 [Mycobacterium sp. NPDC003449]
MPQVEAMGYRIDMVVTGAKGRLAIECDGDFWHGPEQYENDLARQRELERCGWEFHRIRESMFYADMPGTLQGLRDTLDELDIRTAYWIEVGFEDGDELDESEDMGEESHDDTEPEVVEMVSLDWLDVAFIVDDDDFDVVDIDECGGGALASYTAFNDSLPPIQDTPLPALVANIVRIVEVEGPVLGHRLHDAYRDAYGGQRIGKAVAQQLNRAIQSAVRRGHIIADNPLNEPGVKPRTFRVPSQPEVVLRVLGPRTLNLVPPAELAAHLAEFAALDDLSDDEVFRAVLDILGLKRLTDNVRQVLSDASKLVSDLPSREPQSCAGDAEYVWG